MIHWIRPSDAPEAFPPVAAALRDPDGLLAAGGDLSSARLLAAYRRGIFPWYETGQPILWWSPDPRVVLYPDQLRISRSLRKTLKGRPFRLTLDTDFAGVLRGCAAPRRGQAGTWITAEMHEAFLRLHALGHAHSIETWDGEELVGGLYGLALGRVFFGESMFSRRRDASKVALAHLVTELRRRNFALIDCQAPSAHLARLGARPVARTLFTRMLDVLCEPARPAETWHSALHTWQAPSD